MLKIRDYEEKDWRAIERIHDAARKIELALAGLPEAFLPLSIAAEREDLFEYPGLYVAEEDGEVVGFAACTREELAWLYVDPARLRQGIGRRLSEYAMEKFPGICRVEALQGNEPARALYERLGFQVVAVEKGGYREMRGTQWRSVAWNAGRAGLVTGGENPPKCAGCFNDFVHEAFVIRCERRCA